jgi:translation elongation factor P/translation initiation factor 5A
VAEVISTNQFRNGMHVEIDGDVWRIVEFQHVKPGKGGAFVRTKLKNLGSGAVVDKTFRAGEKFTRIHTEVKSVQYLYDAGTEVVFMDEETYEQIHLPRSDLEDELAFVEPSSSVHPAAILGRAHRLQDGARRAWRYGVERHEARDARDGSRGPGAAVRERGGPYQGGPQRAALHLQGLTPHGP